MTFQPADTLSLVGFVAFSALMFGVCLFVVGQTRNAKAWLVGFVSLIALVSTSAGTGFTASHVIPALPIFFGLFMLVGFAFSFSRSGTDVANRLSLSALIGFQSFRLPLEVILHQWAKRGTIPETMTWTGSNWDIVVGIICLITCRWASVNRGVAWFAQLVGVVLLANVLRVVILSSPFPFSWPLENPLQLALHFPYVLILPLFVLPALVAHLLTFRKLLSSQSGMAEDATPPAS